MILEEKKFGRWTVIEPGKTKNGKPGYKCQCDCGKIKVVASCHLKNGGSRSCGCLKSELSREYKNPRTLQLDGQKFGRWLVLNTEKGKNNKSVCVCLCDCGNLKKVSGHELKRGKSKSCGCLTRELASLRSRKR